MANHNKRERVGRPLRPDTYLDTIMTSRTERQNVINRMRKKRRRRNGIALCVVMAGLVSVVLFAERQDIIDIDLPPLGSTVFAATMISLDQYESEYAQFGLMPEQDVVVLLEDGTSVSASSLEQSLDSVGLTEPDSQGGGQDEGQNEPEAEPSIIATRPVDSDAPIVDEISDDDEEPYDGGCPVVLLDGVPACTLASADDAQWVRTSLLEKFTNPVAGGKPTKRGFANGFSIKYSVEKPETVMSREEAYLMLSEKVQVRLREEIEVEKTVPFKTETIEDPTLKKGTKRTQQEGKNGKSVQVYEVVSINGEEIERNPVGKAKITEPPVNKVVVKGTLRPVSTPKPKQPSVVIPVESAPVTSSGSSSSANGNSSASSSSSTSAKADASAVPYTGPKTTYGSQTPGNYSVIPLPDKSYAFPGSDVGSGKYYPNIDTTQRRPGRDQGIAGPSPGNLHFIHSLKGYGAKDATSYFGWRFSRMHYATDTFAPKGTPILASESGKVTSYTGNHNGYGLTVEIDHGNGFTTRYAHCDSILVESGQKVSQGQQIATVGATGTEDGKTHLHFEIRHNGVPYNPFFYM